MFPITSRVAWRLACPLAALLLAALCPFKSSAQTLIPARSSWKYLANGTDQESFWTQPAFNDSAWSSGPGPLGFGDTHIVTTLPSGFITYYFRRAFTIAD